MPVEDMDIAFPDLVKHNFPLRSSEKNRGLGEVVFNQIGKRYIPTLHLHQLKGDRKGIWAVTVQSNWRITFRFEDGDAEIVNYEDYH